MPRAFAKLSENDKTNLNSLVTKVKQSGKITLELLREFKTLDIAR